MADISMCFNESCKDKMRCYRYTALVNPYRQSVVQLTGDLTKETCKMFWNNEGYRKDPKRFPKGGEK